MSGRPAGCTQVVPRTCGGERLAASHAAHACDAAESGDADRRFTARPQRSRRPAVPLFSSCPVLSRALPARHDPAGQSHIARSRSPPNRTPAIPDSPAVTVSLHCTSAIVAHYGVPPGSVALKYAFARGDMSQRQTSPQRTCVIAVARFASCAGVLQTTALRHLL